MQQVQMGGALKNDLWITDPEEKPDPSPLPDQSGYHVLVRPVSVKSKTKGGIFIPDSTREDMSYLTTVGQVLAMGDLAYCEKDKHIAKYMVEMIKKQMDDQKEIDQTAIENMLKIANQQIMEIRNDAER